MILLEPTTREHLPYLLDMVRLPEVAEMLFWDYGRVSLETLPATLLSAAPDTTSRAFSIIVQEALAGVVTLNDIHPIHRSATVGILAVQPGLPQRGMYGYYAVREAVKHAFTALNLNRLDCRVMAHNKPVQTICKRVGCKLDGIAREAIYKDGAYVDIKLFSILKGDWDGARST